MPRRSKANAGGPCPSCEKQCANELSYRHGSLTRLGFARWVAQPRGLTRRRGVVVRGAPPKRTFLMKFPIFICSFLIACSCVAVLTTVPLANAQVNVTQFHNDDSRDGLYIDSAFTRGAAANLTRDLDFDRTIVGNVYAQPLYLDNGPGGRATIIAVTESN